jgi:hypothetical protein
VAGAILRRTTKMMIAVEPEYLRGRAARCRALAHEVRGDRACHILLGLAAEYEGRAAELEAAANDKTPAAREA